MAARPLGPTIFAALAYGALGMAVMGLGVGCGEARLYPLREKPTDARGDVTDADGRGGDRDGMDGGGTEPTDSGEDAPTPTCPNTPVVGFASLTSPGVDGGAPQVGTTGGGNAPAVTVTTLDDFAVAASDATPGPLVIRVSGMLAFPSLDGGTTGQQKRVSSNKTIVGADANSGLTGGGLYILSSTNVIVRNLKISGAFHTDAITVQASKNVWIDHCDLSCDPAQPNACDGLVDITHASDFVTVSWTSYHDHSASGLVGHSDNAAAEDTNHLTVTYHHDLYTNVFTGPRVRFGTVHVFNVDFEHLGDYAVASTDMASVLVESSVFNDVRTPLTTTVLGSQSVAGFLAEGSSDRTNSYLAPTSPADNTFTPTSVPPPQYTYASVLDRVGSVQTIVQACAGTGKVPPLSFPTP